MSYREQREHYKRLKEKLALNHNQMFLYWLNVGDRFEHNGDTHEVTWKGAGRNVQLEAKNLDTKESSVYDGEFVIDRYSISHGNQ